MTISDARSACDLIYRKIIETGERESAERIRDVCESLIDLPDVPRITTALIGEICTKRWGGPRAQSITNKPATLAALVKAYNCLKQVKRGKPSRLSKFASGVQARIDDPGLALQVSALISDLDECRRNNRSLTGLIEKHLTVNSDGTIAPNIDTWNLTTKDARIPTKIELDAVNSFLKKQHMERFGLSIDNKGRLMEGRQTFMEAPMVLFLQRLTAISS